MTPFVCIISLLSGTTRWCKVVLYNSCPWPQINYFSRESWFPLLNNRDCLRPDSLVNIFWCNLRAAWVKEIESKAGRNEKQGKMMHTWLTVLLWALMEPHPWQICLHDHVRCLNLGYIKKLFFWWHPQDRKEGSELIYLAPSVPYFPLVTVHSLGMSFLYSCSASSNTFKT